MFKIGILLLLEIIIILFLKNSLQPKSSRTNKQTAVDGVVEAYAPAFHNVD
jgi:hypothetical protein